MNNKTNQASEQPAQQQEPGAYDKTEINCFAQDLYDQKMREGKRGHYESMFHVIHQCIKKVSPQPSKPLTDEEIKRLKPISADFVSFRAGVRCMEREWRNQPASKPLPEDYTALEQALTRLQKRYADLEGRASKPLTDEEIEQVCVPLGAAMLSFTEVARAIEAKLREKNA